MDEIEIIRNFNSIYERAKTGEADPDTIASDLENIMRTAYRTNVEEDKIKAHKDLIHSSIVLYNKKVADGRHLPSLLKEDTEFLVMLEKNLRLVLDDLLRKHRN